MVRIGKFCSYSNYNSIYCGKLCSCSTYSSRSVRLQMAWHWEVSKTRTRTPYCRVHKACELLGTFFFAKSPRSLPKE